MHVDPKAPFDSPLHPSNIGRASMDELDAAASQPPTLDELLEVHRTAGEREADLTPDRAELERRDQLVAEHEEDPNPEYAPTLVDMADVEHRWEEDGWQPVEPADDAQEDAEAGDGEEHGEPPQDAEKPEPKKRTGRHRKAPAKTAAPKLDAALAKLDRARGKK